MGYYSNRVIEDDESFGNILYAVIKRNDCIEDVFVEMEKYKHLIRNDEEYSYTISGTFEFEVNATNEDEALEKVNDELRLENINYDIWGGE